MGVIDEKQEKYFLNFKLNVCAEGQAGNASRHLRCISGERVRCSTTKRLPRLFTIRNTLFLAKFSEEKK